MLRITKIAFPGLGIGEFSVDSVAFRIKDFSVAWYALIITLGMICAVTYIVLKSKEIGITAEDVIDYAIFVIPFGVLGARIYYVLMELDKYDSLIDAFNIRQGGLAIYGGIIAGTLTVFLVSLKKKIYFPAFGDYVVPGVILAQAIGRWGNFMNGEAYGYQTDIFCRMGLDFGLGMEYYHPTFLYESLWNFIGFIGVNILFKYKKYDGQMILIVFGWYGLGRMFIEGLRTDSLYLFGNVRVSQLLAALIFIACTTLLIYFAIKHPKRELFKKEIKEKK